MCPLPLSQLSGCKMYCDVDTFVFLMDIQYREENTLVQSHSAVE